MSGQGYEYSKENGQFHVYSETTGMKEFNKLSKAKTFYESLEGEKAIWDITTIPELIDSSDNYDKILK